MSNDPKPIPYVPHMIGSAEFANGSKFRIDQIKKSGRCRVTNLINDKTNYTHNPVNAWASVRYMAKISQKSERST